MAKLTDFAGHVASFCLLAECWLQTISHTSVQLYVRATKKSLIVRGAINKWIQDELPFLSGFDDSSAFHQMIGNNIIIMTRNFTDEEADAYDTAWRLRHEMSHAGAINKFRFYGRSGDTYRIGARLYSRKRDRSFGLAIDEGHRAIEDEAYKGLSGPFAKMALPETISRLPELFPEGYARYQQVVKTARESGKLPDGKMITYDLPEHSSYGYCDHYDTYRNLMLAVYAEDESLFRAAKDFIYFDHMKSFRQKVDRKYGEGFFMRLMEVNDREQSQSLLDSMKS